MPNILMPDGVTVSFPEETPPEQIKAMMREKYPDDFGPEGNELTRGIARGVETTKALVSEGVPAVAKGLANDALQALGFEEAFEPRQNLEEYQRKVQEAYQAHPTDVGSFKDIEGIGDVGKYIAGAAGEQIPQLGLSLGSGGIGGFVGKQAVKQLAKKGGVELTKAQLNKAMQRGILGGTLSSSAAQNVPETYMNILGQGKDEASKAVLFGALKTGLDTAAPLAVLKKVLGPSATDMVAKSLLSRIGTEGTKAALGEGATEAAQEGVDLIAEQFILDNKEMFTEENITKLIDSGLKGAIGGGMMGAGAAPLMGDRLGLDNSFDYSKLSPEDKTQLDEKLMEEAIGIAPKKEENPLATTVVEPSYVPEEALTLTEGLGVQKESVNLVSPKDVQDTDQVLNTTLNEALDVRTALNVNPVPQELVPSLQARKQDIDNEQRTDPNFIVGDGVVVVGAPVNPEATLRNTQARLKVENTALLETHTTQPGVVAKGIETTLPPTLVKSKPRYKTSKLEFASDLDKAAYIISNPKKSAKKHKDFVSWLTKATGMQEADLVLQGKELRKKIKEIDQAKPNQESITVPYRVEPVFQRVKLPAYGNLRDDLVVPSVVHNNLKGVSLTPEALVRQQDIIRQAQRIVKEVAGDKVMFAPFQELTDMENNPVAGAKFLNIVAVAFNEKTLSSTNETAYHEAYHALEDMGAISEKEMDAVDNNTSVLLDYLNKDEYLKGQDYQVLLASKEGRAEIRANAFGKWAVEQNRGEPSVGITPQFKKFFQKLKNILERLGNALKGLGFTSLDDLFTSALDGTRAVDAMDNINYNNRVARMQRIGEAYQEQNNAERNSPAFEDLVHKQMVDANKRQKEGKTMGLYGRYIRSMHDAAHNNPFLAVVYDSVDRRIKNSSMLMEKYINILGDFTNQEKGLRHRLHDLADFMRSSNQKGKLDDQGRLTFQRDGKIVRINDPEVSKQYMQMTAAYEEVLNDHEREIKRNAYIEHGKDVLISPQFGTAEVVQARNATSDKKVQKRLDNLLNVLTEVQTMRKSDFVPRMRFGSWGIVVNDKQSGEQVAFLTVENGSFKKTYNKYQLEDTLKQLQDKYSDTDNYEIVGDNGVVKTLSLETLVPFKLTKNNLANNVDARFQNFELLNALMSEGDMDQEAYGDLRQELYNDILTRGFERRFAEAKNSDGYSNDWNRVQHAYLSGSAHHFAGIPFQQEVAVLTTEAEKLRDAKVTARAKSFLNYSSNPAEDLIALRTFNFLWTMGGNVSTAALQMMTLPTTTLGGMSQFDPNPIKNMQLIGKWFALGINEFAPKGLVTVFGNEGIAHLAFNQKDTLDKLIANGKITRDQAHHIERLYDEGKIRGLLTEESVGSRQFETRGTLGKAREGLATTANYLGLPITIMEQLTRFATTMAVYDQLASNPQALKRAEKVLSVDPLFQVQLKTNPNKSFTELAAAFTMDEAHAVFGKLGRPEFMRHVGGALFFPFMTYPQQAIEFMARMYGRGPEGKKALATTLGALFLLSGLMGLPGGELLKELLEEVEKQVTGSEEDFDLMIREKIYDATGDAKFAKFITQGLLRGYGGLDVSRRIGLPIPGQDILLNVTGIRGDSSDMLGVSGSLLGALGDAWNEYNNDSSLVKIASSLAPVAPANVLKAMNYSKEGVRTKRGLQLVTPEEMTAKTKFARMIGITSDQVATKREEQYFKQLLETKHSTAIERYRGKAKNISTELEKARAKGQHEKVKTLQKKWGNVIMELQEYAEKNNIPPIPIAPFNRSVIKATKQRTDTSIYPKDVRKIARQALPKMQQVIGVTD